jgi:hypothetical protein
VLPQGHWEIGKTLSACWIAASSRWTGSWATRSCHAKSDSLDRNAEETKATNTFLLMKRSEKGPNTFSQEIKNLHPGRLYSMKMFSCDYKDLVNPQKKNVDEANKFLGKVTLEGVDIDTKRSLTETYPSGPEPPIPVWITYHWTVFRANGVTAQLTVSDWPSEKESSGTYGQEQTFNFLEIQPYHE